MFVRAFDGVQLIMCRGAGSILLAIHAWGFCPAALLLLGKGFPSMAA
jgi:hypothetical protein